MISRSTCTREHSIRAHATMNNAHAVSSDADALCMHVNETKSRVTWLPHLSGIQLCELALCVNLDGHSSARSLTQGIKDGRHGPIAHFFNQSEVVYRPVRGGRASKGTSRGRLWEASLPSLSLRHRNWTFGGDRQQLSSGASQPGPRQQ